MPLETHESFPPEVLSASCEFDDAPEAPQPKPTGQWEPSDGTPGKAAEPQSQTRRFEAVNTVIGGVNCPQIIFKNPGVRA